MTDAPAIPANLAPYVDAMGRQLAVRFFLRFGGAPLYIPENPTSKSALAGLIGERAVRRLFEHFDNTEGGTKNVRVPQNRRWLAAQMASDGVSKLEIARQLRVTDVTVRSWLKEPKQTAQLALDV